MSIAGTWNDASRQELRETLRSAIVGEVRLAKNGRDDVLAMCREVHMPDACPESERESFDRFAADEFDRIAAAHAADLAASLDETDCDRLDRVELALRDRGILLWQASPCCDTCTWGELPDRIDVIESRCPGFAARIGGYAFFIDQNLPERLAEDSRVSVWFAYGWFSPDGVEVPPKEYEVKALGIAQEVCECLRAEGLEVDWDGDFDCKIGVALNWQRRTPLD